VRVLSRGEGAIRQRHLKKVGVEPKLGELKGRRERNHHVNVPRFLPKSSPVGLTKFDD
jgi:hypothetical protein